MANVAGTSMSLHSSDQCDARATGGTVPNTAGSDGVNGLLKESYGPFVLLVLDASEVA